MLSFVLTIHRFIVTYFRRYYANDLQFLIYYKHGSAVSIATGYGLDRRGVEILVPVVARFFSSPHRPDRFWGSPSLQCDGYRGGGAFSGSKAPGA
jgi:hypothetical protein